MSIRDQLGAIRDGLQPAAPRGGREPGRRTLTDGMAAAVGGAARGMANSIVEPGRAPTSNEQFGRILQPVTESSGVPLAAETALRQQLGHIIGGSMEDLQGLEGFVRRTGWAGTPMNNLISMSLDIDSEGHALSGRENHRIQLTGRLRLANIIPAGRAQATATTINSSANSSQGTSSTESVEASGSIGGAMLGFGAGGKVSSSQTETAAAGEGSGESKTRQGSSRELEAVVLLFLSGTDHITEPGPMGTSMGPSSTHRIALAPICLGKMTLWSEG